MHRGRRGQWREEKQRAFCSDSPLQPPPERRAVRGAGDRSPASRKRGREELGDFNRRDTQFQGDLCRLSYSRRRVAPQNVSLYSCVKPRNEEPEKSLSISDPSAPAFKVFQRANAQGLTKVCGWHQSSATTHCLSQSLGRPSGSSVLRAGPVGSYGPWGERDLTLLVAPRRRCRRSTSSIS